MKLVLVVIMTSLALYWLMIGLKISGQVLQNYLPLDWFDKLNQYFALMPYSEMIQNWVGSRFEGASGGVMTWWTMVVGIPLMLISISMIVANWLNLWLALFDKRYNQANCRWCNLSN